jgi:hypothetical protein
MFDDDVYEIIDDKKVKMSSNEKTIASPMSANVFYLLN